MAIASGVKLCQNCNARPVYVENGRNHDFCGIRCAKANRQGSPMPPDRTNSTTSTGSVTTCLLAGCNRRAHVDRRSGQSSEYCSQGHRSEAVDSGQAEACLRCKRWPKALVNGRRSEFCSRKCSQDTIEAAPTILEVSSTDQIYEDVTKQFQEQWRHQTAIPSVVAIWKIFTDKEVANKFDRYKLSVERRTGEDGGNSRRRWHGTVRACKLGEDSDEDTLCMEPACSLCCIIRSSFQLAKFGQRTNFGRFGQGIYTSATSSKANDYVAQALGTSAKYKAILLNNVVMGKVEKLTRENQHLTEPSPGYDSVVGEPGGDLNYDESIVYKNEAIRPLYLVIFDQTQPQAGVVASPPVGGGARQRRISLGGSS